MIAVRAAEVAKECETESLSQLMNLKETVMMNFLPIQNLNINQRLATQTNVLVKIREYID